MITIKIPNFAFGDSDNSIVPDELIILMFLLKNRNFDSEITISINLLSSIFKFKKGNDRENRPHIKEILLSLNMKKYIDTNINTVSGNDDVITGKVINLNKGYCGIKSNVYDEIFQENDIVKAKLKLFIYAYISSIKGNGKRTSYERFSSMCRYYKSVKKYSVSVIFNLIDEMDGKYIYKFSGERIDGKVEQDANTYYTELPFDKMKKYSDSKDESRRARKNDELVYTVSYGEITVKRLKEIANSETNWQKRRPDGQYEEINEHDYEIYRACLDENVDLRFIKRCQKGIETMKNSTEELQYDWAEMEKVYLRNKELTLL